MKKNIFYSAAFGMMALAFTACSSEMDCDFAHDNESASAVATMYTYAASGDEYNPDTDLRVRLVKGTDVKAAYLLVEPQSAKNPFIENVIYKYDGEDIVDSTIVYNEQKYMDYVIEKGQAVTFDEEGVFEVVKANLLGDYRLVAVSVANNDKKTSQEVLFHGVGWNTLATGTFNYGTLGGLGLAPKTGVVLQQNSDDPSLYRIKNAYADGYDLTFTVTKSQDEDEDGVYTVLRVPDQSTGLTYGSYGTIRVRDVGVWQSDDSWAYPSSLGGKGYVNGMYEDGYCFFQCEYYLSAGYLGYQEYDTFVPDEE